MQLKKHLFIFILLFSGSIKFIKAQTIIDSLSDIKEITYKQDKIYALLNNDVIKYYNINGVESELEKSAYKKTNEYKEKLAEMQLDKKKLYCIKIKFYENDPWWHIPKYDFKSNGFNVYLGKNVDLSPTNTPDKCYNNIGKTLRFSQLKTFKTPSIYKGSYYEYFNIPIEENIALNMERDKENIYIYYIFRLIDIKNIKYNFCRAGKFMSLSAKVIDTKNLRIIIENDKNKNIYKDITY